MQNYQSRQPKPQSHSSVGPIARRQGDKRNLRNGDLAREFLTMDQTTRKEGQEVKMITEEHENGDKITVFSDLVKKQTNE